MLLPKADLTACVRTERSARSASPAARVTVLFCHSCFQTSFITADPGSANTLTSGSVIDHLHQYLINDSFTPRSKQNIINKEQEFTHHPRMEQEVCSSVGCLFFPHLSHSFQLLKETWTDFPVKRPLWVILPVLC